MLRCATQGRGLLCLFGSLQVTVCSESSACVMMCDHSANASCSSDEFRCESGRCIPAYYTCDDYNQCGAGDYSDERNCSKRYFSVFINCLCVTCIST